MPTPLLDLLTSLGAVAIWRGNEGAGTVAADARGNHPGTYAGGVSFGAALSQDDAAGSVVFDGSNGVASVPDHDALEARVGFSAVSLVDLATVDHAQIGNYPFIKRGVGSGSDNGGGWAFSLRYGADAGKLGLSLFNSSIVTTATAEGVLPTTGVHLVGFSVDASNIRLYLDGSLVHTGPTPTGIAGSVGPLYIGGIHVSSAGETDGYRPMRRGEQALFHTALSTQNHADLWAAAGGSQVLSVTAPSLASKTDTTVSVSASASGGQAPYAYQWQRSSDGSNWANIAGATSAALEDTGLSPQTTYHYRVVVTDAAEASATSSSLAVTTEAAQAAGAISGTAQFFDPEDETIKTATSGTFYAVSVGDGARHSAAIQANGSYEITGLAAGSYHTFTVITVNGQPQTSQVRIRTVS